MTTELYRSFEGKLDVDRRTGFTISSIANGNLRINTLTTYRPALEFTYYIKPTERFNADTVFTDDLAGELLDLIQHDVVEPYRTIKEKT